MGDETESALIDLARAPDLNLTARDDPWPIFEFVLNQANKPLPDKSETLASFDEIDSERRPLFAYFTADAIARGVDIRHLDADRLLDVVIEHSRNAYWKPAGAKEEDERLLAVATMAGGVAVDALDGVAEKLLPSWDIDRHPPIFLAMTGRESDKDIAPLGPDIVGEHFVLSRLAQRNLSDSNRLRFCELAWQLNPPGTAQFVWRVMHDFRSPGPRAPRPLFDDMRTLAVKRNEPALWEVWAVAGANLMIGLASGDPIEARVLLDDMHRVAQERDEAALWAGWAQASANLIISLESRDPVMSRALVNDMLETVMMHPGAVGGWQTIVVGLVLQAAFTLTKDLGSRDPDAARAFCAETLGMPESMLQIMTFGD